MQKIENPYWTSEENIIVEDILKQWNLSSEQEKILKQQITQIQSFQSFLTLLLEIKQDWQTLQDNINLNFNNYGTQQYQNSQINQYHDPSQFYVSEIIFQKKQQNGEETSKKSSDKIQSNFGNSKQKLPPPINSQGKLQQNKQEIEIMNYLKKELQKLNGKEFTQVLSQVEQVYQRLTGEQNQNFSNSELSNSPQLTTEDLIFLCKGVKAIFQYYPRQVQLMSVVLLYNHESNKGRLAQIYTGEGKTLIVAMLAVLLCKKKNCNVDIVTSSSVLAERDSKDYAQFYKYFKLTVSHNIHKDQIIKDGVLPCYNCQIIYGDSSSFQADILRHEYSEQGTMGNRKQQYAIIDEVDSMLIDGHRNKTLLSSPIPGMLDLSKVLQLIWQEICKVEHYLSTDFKVMIVDKNNYYSVDLDEYIEKTLDKQLEACVNEFIPKFRMKYIHHMKKTWIKKAMHAKFYLKIDKDYVVNNGVAKIVDFENTGVIHGENNTWAEGLHQFIQMKHNLNVTPLNLTTNYLSNVTFFKRYGSTLLGLTGTLGSKNSQNLLAKQYNVDFIFLPPFKQRNLVEEFSMAVQVEQEWLEEIQKAVQEQMKKKRAVLIINKTIQDAEKVLKALQGYKNIVKYTDDSQVISKNIGPNGIVIATNLAGRGTDFITNNDLEENGGLHVIMSFLPQSIRIQEQGFGRTCRQGKKGSAQLIVQFKTNLYKNPSQNFQTFEQAIEYWQKQVKQENICLIDVVKFFRDENEKHHMDNIEIEMAKLVNEDKCFERFCQIAKQKVNMKKNRSAFKSLEEKWGLYLEINKEKRISVNEVENFLNEQDNPKYLIIEGLQQSNLEKITEADKEKKDPQAQYYKGILELEQKKYEQGAESLMIARQLFQSKIENERGFASAVMINQQQIDQNENFRVVREKQPEIQLQNFEKQESQIFFQPNNDNLAPIQQKEQSQINQNRISQKVNNHIKVYKRVMDNIDDLINTLKSFDPTKEELQLDWEDVLQKDEQVEESESDKKDQNEVVNDGPLPSIAKGKKVEKKTSGMEYLSLFVFGAFQFALGAVISTFSCGLAMPIAKALMQNGISDMILSVTSFIKGTSIDWDTWRKNKLLSYSTALLLAGPDGIREALEIGKNAMKSIKKEGFAQFLNKMQNVSEKELKEFGSTLPKEQKKEIEKSHQTVQQLSQIACLNLSYEDLQQMTQEVIQDQVLYGTLSQETGKELTELVDQSFNQAKQSNGSVKDAIVTLGAKYLKTKIGQKKAELCDGQHNQQAQCIVENKFQEKYKNAKSKIEYLQGYKQRLTNEVNQFSKIFWDCFSLDREIQKQIILYDLYFEIKCDLKRVQSQVNSSKIQEIIRHKFSINQCKKFLTNFQMANPDSVGSFYNEIFKPVFQNIVECFKNQIKITEPLEIILSERIKIQRISLSEKLNQQKKDLEAKRIKVENEASPQVHQINAFNQELVQYEKTLQQFKEITDQNIKEITQKIVLNLVKFQLIINDELQFQNNIIEESNQFLNANIQNKILKQVFQSAMKESIQQGKNIYQGLQKYFSTLLKQSIELQILDEIKKFIFQEKLQKEEQTIMK